MWTTNKSYIKTIFYVKEIVNCVYYMHFDSFDCWLLVVNLFSYIISNMCCFVLGCGFDNCFKWLLVQWPYFHYYYYYYVSQLKCLYIQFWIHIHRQELFCFACKLFQTCEYSSHVEELIFDPSCRVYTIWLIVNLGGCWKDLVNGVSLWHLLLPNNYKKGVVIVAK